MPWSWNKKFYYVTYFLFRTDIFTIGQWVIIIHTVYNMIFFVLIALNILSMKCFTKISNLTWSVNSTMVVVTSDPLGWVSVLTSVFLTVGVIMTSLASLLSGGMVATRLGSLCDCSLSTDDDTGTDLFGFLGTTGLREEKRHVLVFTGKTDIWCLLFWNSVGKQGFKKTQWPDIKNIFNIYWSFWRTRMNKRVNKAWEDILS